MYKLVFIWVFIAQASWAYILPASWVMGELSKRCADFYTSPKKFTGTYQQDNNLVKHVDIYLSTSGIRIGDLSSTPILSYFLGDYFKCAGLDWDKKSSMTLCMKNGLACYKFTLPSGETIMIDKDTYVPVEQVGENFEVSASAWRDIFQDNKLVPTEFSFKNGDRVERVSILADQANQ